MKNKLFLLLFFLAISGMTQAQSKLVFDFDAAGNQIQRQICVRDCKLISTEFASKAAAGDSAVPIAEQFDESVIMYPNPTNGVLNLSWDKELRGVVQKVQLFNYQGRLLQEYDVADLQQTKLDLSSYPTGAYLAKFVFTDASIHARQIIKK